ncbi:uncharacterized protein LOC134285397 [Aedes albopictus]|uniref:Zinc finger PHD-type domain-containing protein n=1 Tax=Aedes albopictus TaxID=7160 RepID=A0ABM1Z4X2_AEDAL
MPDNPSIATTTCGACGLVIQDGELECASCGSGYHYQCVGVMREELVWYCLQEDCQNQKDLVDQASKTGTRKKKKKPVDDNTDAFSVKSDGKLCPTLDSQARSLSRKKQLQLEEIQEERILREKRLEVEHILHQRRLEMESELHEKELRQENRLLEKILEERQNHLKRMKNMHQSYQARFDKIQYELDKMKQRNRNGSREFSINDGTLDKGHSVDFYENSAANEDSSEEEDGEVFMDDPREETDKESVSRKRKKRNKRKFGRKSTEYAVERLPAIPTKAQLAARNGISQKLPTFSGKLEEWPLFIGSYRASNEACGYSNVENLVRLQESLRGQALESVRGQLLFPKTVPNVISKLQQLYGRPELLLQWHLEQLQNLKAPKSDKLASYIPFGNAVDQLCQHLEAADLRQHLMNPLLVQQLVDKLPSNDKREWIRFKKQQKKVTLQTFNEFVSGIVSEACEANVCIEYEMEHFEYKTARDAHDEHDERSGSNYTEKEAVYTHFTPEAKYDRNQHRRSCKMCGRNDHRLRFCRHFKELSVEHRMRVVNEWGLCAVCLNYHGNAPCHSKLRCNVRYCVGEHNTLLHPVGKNVKLGDNVSSNSSTLFRMIPVTLYYGTKSIDTLAFLDEGASATLIDETLADQLGVMGTKQQFTLDWTSGITRVEQKSRQMNLLISARNGLQKFSLNNVRTVDNLQLPLQSLDTNEVKAQASIIEDLPIAPYELQRPGLLIGLNNINVIAPINAKVAKSGELVAVQSKLGWAVYGQKQKEIYENERMKA